MGTLCLSFDHTITMATTIGLILLACICTIQCMWVKEMENVGVFQGDIMLDPDEKEGIWKTNSFASIKGGRWPNAKIPYVIESSIRQQGVNAINQAIEDYHQYTCLRFVKRTTESTYVRFFRGGGCYSPVGYRAGRNNGISIGIGCEYKSTVMHEIGHTIGIYHEQSRPDRDNYVNIIWNNITPRMQYNFNKQAAADINSLGTTYDYRSMMHYNARAFGNGKITIQTSDPKMQNVIGRYRGFSEIDKKQINLMYCDGEVKPTNSPPTNPPPSNCKDLQTSCGYWAGKGYCTHSFVDYMKRYCKKSCNLC